MNQFLCVKCSNRTRHPFKIKNNIGIVTSNEAFKWSICGHIYCAKCASNIINKSLSSFNSIPSCVYPKCNKLLNIRDGHKLKRFLYKKYQINLSIQDYKLGNYLVSGYIKLNSFVIIPLDIILLISDYYSLLSIMTKINCYINNCESTSITECDCLKQNLAKYINDKMVTKCKCYKNITQICKTCHGNGSRKFKRKRKKCIKCNGIGTVKISSQNCNICNGKKYIICKKCKGRGFILSGCECQGTKYLMALDFDKLCKRQLHLSGGLDF